MITEILKKAGRVFPTDKARHHLSLNPETERLELTIFYGGKFYPCILDNEEELQKGESLINEIHALIAAESKD